MGLTTLNLTAKGPYSLKRRKTQLNIASAEICPFGGHAILQLAVKATRGSLALQSPAVIKFPVAIWTVFSFPSCFPIHGRISDSQVTRWPSQLLKNPLTWKPRPYCLCATIWRSESIPFGVGKNRGGLTNLATG
jgi:hypothetical protein